MGALTSCYTEQLLGRVCTEKKYSSASLPCLKECQHLVYSCQMAIDGGAERGGDQGQTPQGNNPSLPSCS